LKVLKHKTAAVKAESIMVLNFANEKSANSRQPLRICLTGGPCAGKTSVTEIVRREFSNLFEVIPESASILYRGGFLRAVTAEEMRWVQRAIFHVQEASESLAYLALQRSDKKSLIRGFVFDRGSVDGAAYWPDGPEDFYKSLGTSKEKEYSRYDCVIHMESAAQETGYFSSEHLRTESLEEAQALDRRIQEAWASHPHRYVISSRDSFIDKVDEVIRLLKKFLEECSPL
jgi:predicted ATPase